MALIKADPARIGELYAQEKNISIKLNDAADAVSSVISHLDWEVASKSDISNRLNSVKNRLQKQAQKASGYAGALNDVRNGMGAKDALIRNKAKGIIYSLSAIKASVFAAPKKASTKGSSSMITQSELAAALFSGGVAVSGGTQGALAILHQIADFLNPGKGDTDTQVSMPELRAMVAKYVPTILNNREIANIEEYRSTIQEYIKALKEKGYDCCEMRKAFKMAAQVGKSDSGWFIPGSGYDSMLRFTTGSDNNQENAMYTRQNDNGGHDVVFAFHGTDVEWGDIMSNLDTGSGDSHAGYWKRANEIYERNPMITVGGRTISLQDLIREAKEGKTNFVLTGHSMGGAIAQLFAICLLNQGVPATQIKGYTFNCAPAVLKENPHYNEDLHWFNINNTSDNVSAGEMKGGLSDIQPVKDQSGEVVGARYRLGQRLGYDIPLYDGTHSRNSFPDGEHHVTEYMDQVMDSNRTLIGCSATGGNAVCSGFSDLNI